MTLIGRLAAVLQAIGSDIKSVLPWADKTPPTGSVVGTSDAQTLSGKTLASPIIDNALRFKTLAMETAASASTTIDFSTGQKRFLTVQANTALTFSFPGIGNYQVVVAMASPGGYSVTLPGVTWWVGAASQPAFNTTSGGRTLLSLYWDGLQCYCGVAKLNAV